MNRLAAVFLLLALCAGGAILWFSRPTPPAVKPAPIAAKPAGPTPQQRIATLVAGAQAKIAAGNFKSAIADCTEALKLGNDATAHLARGEAEGELAQYQAAAADESAVLALQPNSWQALYWRAAAEDRIAGGLDAAATDLAASLKLNPKDGAAFAESGLVAFEQSRLPDAIYDETQAIVLFMTEPMDFGHADSHVLALAIRADAEVGLFRYADAKQDAQAAINLGGGGTWRGAAFKVLGYVYLKTGNDPKALDALTQARTLNPSDAEIPKLIAQAEKAEVPREKTRKKRR